MSDTRACPTCGRVVTVEVWRAKKWGKECNACCKRRGRAAGAAWADRDRVTSQAWKERNRERNRARDRAYAALRRKVLAS